VLQNKASILREKDIMQPDEVTSPARRIYFPVMMMYLDPPDAGAYWEEFVLRMNEFMGAVRNAAILSECVSTSREVMAGEFYKALNRCRKLIDYEDERLNNVAEGIPEGGGAGGIAA
jgi:flagellar protein FlbT